MRLLPEGLQPAAGEEVSPRSQHGPGGLFLMTLWFGLVAGWLDLGMVLAQRAIDLHVSDAMVRTNQHFVWMVPVSDVLIFGVVGLAIVLLAWFRRGLAWWIAMRLPVGMSFLTLLLNIESLHAIASAILACGLGW